MNNSTNEKIITVGRSSSCNIVINNPNVSSSHAKFIINDNTVTLEDIGSTNGTYVNDEKITSKIVTKESRITFSKNYVFDWNKLEPFIKLSSGEVSVQTEERLKTKIVQEKNVITIGRTRDNDLVINNIKVSRKHARIEKKDDEWF
ncbi:MAG: FHA domain-containing protein, partial [Ignavibacteriaceae bacterium]